MLRCYVAAPYRHAPVVRSVHRSLRTIGWQPTSEWAESAKGPEELEKMPLELVRQIARANDRDVESAHALLALAHEGEGAEMFCELRYAAELGIPVVYAGARKCLSAYRPGVLRVDDMLEGLEVLAEASRRMPSAMQGHDEFVRARLLDLWIERGEAAAHVA